ncbi:sensor histidine kinase [Cohnella faecalis]|uniref:sensor histidine kinase n=1 Tax=Cohnella faecalis TaxID=2315694 RepID=UPI0026B45CA6|nr:sensor histidine kinase [Cohnella faecalis]
MMRFVRNSKWEWTLYTGAISLAMALFFAWTETSDSPIEGKDWYGWAAGLIVLAMAVGYVLGRRTQQRIDQLQLAIKQAAAGNWTAKLPSLGMDAFAGVFLDFNAMLSALESRLKLLQQLGEKSVEEVSSQENAVLEERRRLARDLHDTVSQQLFCASHVGILAAQAAGAGCGARGEGYGAVDCDVVYRPTADAEPDRQLRPLELQGRTLEEALDRWFPDYCRQNGLQGTLDIQLRSPVSEAMEHQLFLIIQEAMANVVKHAEAKVVRLFLGETDRQLSLNIEDDGAGFRAEQVRTGAYGLSTMRERAQKLGGEAEIVTKPGSGTRVKVWFPKFEPSTEKESTPK